MLRAIRDGRLRATRVGKSYRILASELDAFAGVPAPAPRNGAEPWITSIVDVPDISAEMAQKWARTVTGALAARPPASPPLRADVIYEPERSHLKIIVVGPPGDVVNLMNMIRVWLEQLDLFGAEARVAAIPVERLGDGFLTLSTHIAGEVVQKFVNYGIRPVFVGDVSAAVEKSDALRDYIRECNRGRHVWFVADLAELETKLAGHA